MAFINYCMALESLSESQTEIPHQIGRTRAILNSETKLEGKIIYDNLKKFYSIRSKGGRSGPSRLQARSGNSVSNP